MAVIKFISMFQDIIPCLSVRTRRTFWYYCQSIRTRSPYLVTLIIYFKTIWIFSSQPLISLNLFWSEITFDKCPSVLTWSQLMTSDSVRLSWRESNFWFNNSEPTHLIFRINGLNQCSKTSHFSVSYRILNCGLASFRHLN